jgi:four helix bundle protein
MNDGFKGLKVYQLAYQSAMEIFELSKRFPKEETYSLTDQVRRSSRSVCSNIAEAYRKRRYPRNFTSKLSDSDGEASETIVWIDFARDCKYLDEQKHSSLIAKYEEIGRMLGSMAENPLKFLPQKKQILL